jgi:hypothetical protein
MTPETAMQHARDDIGEMRTAPTHSSCDRLKLAVSGYCRELLDSGVINAGQFAELKVEAEHNVRPSPSVPPHQ